MSAPFRCPRCKAEIDRDYKACPHCGEPVTEFVRRYADEPVDGKYEIVERLGTGGMGEVYKVNHTFLGTTRVIKVIRPQISESRDAHDRFLREARSATKVHHQNVATLHDFSALPDGSHYMVWEYIEGENLAQRIRARGRLQPRYAVNIAIQALHGLEAIHRAGIVHRDISPENLMLTRAPDGEEQVKIIDLGVAKTDEVNDNATRAGVFVGKLRYASPEHLGFLNESERIDGRADVYSLGMVLYEMLTGRPPFEATTPHEYILLHSREAQMKPLNLPADLPGGAELQTVLARGLEHDRNKRFASARDFARALEAVETSLPDPSSTPTVNIPTPIPGDQPTQFTPPPSGRDTLHRQTLRSGSGEAAPTLHTPLPGATLPDARARETQQTAIVAHERHGSGAALLLIAAIVIVSAAVIGFLLMRRNAPATPQNATAQSAAAQQPASSRASVDVVSPAPQPAVTTATTPLTTTTAAPEITSSPVAVETAVGPVAAAPRKPAVTATVAKKEPVAAAPKEPEQPVAPAVRTYIDGDTADSNVNEQTMAELQRQLEGVTQIAVRGNGEMAVQLAKRLKDDYPSLTISETAPVVIDFNGSLERLGRGRKRRSAQATITKNGRPIFRYELQPEEYRVGDTPAEAFARVLDQALRR